MPWGVEVGHEIVDEPGSAQVVNERQFDGGA